MNRETIAVDIDEVLFPFIDEFIKDHNDKYATHLSRDQFHEYEFSGPLELDIPNTIDRVYAFQKQLNSINSEPFEESVEAVNKLSRQYNLAIITARHPQFEPMTIDWLREHYKNFFVSITHIGYAPIMEKPRTKAEVCLKIGAVALIDDSISHILQCSTSGIEGILFGNYPWNQCNFLPPNVTRCHGWSEVLKHYNL